MKIISWIKRNITVLKCDCSNFTLSTLMCARFVGFQYMITLLNSLRLCPQYIVSETTTNWPLIGGLGGAGAVVAVIIIIVIICVYRKRQKKRQLEFAAREQEIEMKDRGKAVAGELIS